VDITKKDLQKVIAELLKACYVVDLLVHEPRLEHIIREIYDGK
jgi:ABC-type uncharacterized transport system ATPase subunit